MDSEPVVEPRSVDHGRRRRLGDDADDLSADMVALVQTALMLPVALVSTPAGALADMFDRRVVGLVALAIALAGSLALTMLAFFDLITPFLLLLFCFIIGSGMALFGPAWQASVSEQVPADALPAAVALNGISYNIARSFGPAIGGVIVAAAGSIAAFAANAILYLPLIVVLLLWSRVREVSRLPPERMARAVISGVRYILHSPSIRIVLARTLATGVAGGSVSALMPIVTRELLHGGAQTYGLMLGTFGMGAVIGALNVSTLRNGCCGDENAIRMCVIVMGAGVMIVAMSGSPMLTAGALLFAGAGWTASVTRVNVGISLPPARWVAGRALAAYQAAIAGGIALGSWIWGSTASAIGGKGCFSFPASPSCLASLLGFRCECPLDSGPNQQALDPLADPEVRLSLTAQSGPIVDEESGLSGLDPAKARSFYAVMQHVQLDRQRNGAYGWSIAEDIADPELWTERFHCPTWHDFYGSEVARRVRARATLARQRLHLAPNLFVSAGCSTVRMQRPFDGKTRRRTGRQRTTRRLWVPQGDTDRGDDY